MNTSQRIAKTLLKIKAVELNFDKPFTYTSGIISPIYCDNRLLISDVKSRELVIKAFIDLIKREKISFDYIAGTATAGIPHAAWIADRMKKPMLYVRAEAKRHGKKNQIEGKFKKGKKVLVVEDLISTGGSSYYACLALRSAGAKVKDCISIFTYQLSSSHNKFKRRKISLHSLTNFKELVNLAFVEDYITIQEKDIILKWNSNPNIWFNKYYTIK